MLAVASEELLMNAVTTTSPAVAFILAVVKGDAVGPPGVPTTSKTAEVVFVFEKAYTITYEPDTVNVCPEPTMGL